MTAASASDRRRIVEILQAGQLLRASAMYPKAHFIASASGQKEVREHVGEMRDAARKVSKALRERESPDLWEELLALGDSPEDLWAAVKLAPYLSAGLRPLVEAEPEAGFLLAPPEKLPRRRRRKPA